MEIIKVSATQQLHLDETSVACIGFFDGVHIGHQELIFKTIQIAKENKWKSACITFDVDPWTVLRNDKSIKNLTSVQERLDMIASFGIEVCYLLEFNMDMAQLSKEAFIQLLKNLEVATIVCGNDFKFAHKNEGNVAYLSQHIPTIVCDMVEKENEKVSSSNIEKAILNGDLDYANECLGRPYAVSGEVIHGQKDGRKLGYPTANVKAKDYYVIPKNGIYSGTVKYEGDTYPAMISIGYNPTMKLRKKPSLEAHILDFDKDIYGKEVSVAFHHYMRSEIKFESKDALIKQLAADEQYVRGQKR